jgi:hypothetical protein
VLSVISAGTPTVVLVASGCVKKTV